MLKSFEESSLATRARRQLMSKADVQLLSFNLAQAADCGPSTNGRESQLGCGRPGRVLQSNGLALRSQRFVVAASFAAFGQQPGPAKELPSNSPSAHSVVLTPQALERQVRSQPSDKLKR
jgi:hypothetical protein